MAEAEESSTVLPVTRAEPVRGKPLSAKGAKGANKGGKSGKSGKSDKSGKSGNGKRS